MNARHLADTLRALADKWMAKGEKIGWNSEAAAHNMAVKDCGDTLDDLLIEYAAEAQPTDAMNDKAQPVTNSAPKDKGWIEDMTAITEESKP